MPAMRRREGQVPPTCRRPIDMMHDALQRLLTAYRGVAQRQMQGLPFYNGRLSVEAVGFRPWEGRLLGVLITPWFMNLILLPGSEDEWHRCPQGSKSQWKFPAGTYELSASRLEDADTHLSAALFSTVQDFPDQTTAREVAREVLVHLFQEASSKNDSSSDGRQCRRVSRRELLNTVLLARD